MKYVYIFYRYGNGAVFSVSLSSSFKVEIRSMSKFYRPHYWPSPRSCPMQMEMSYVLVLCVSCRAIPCIPGILHLGYGPVDRYAGLGFSPLHHNPSCQPAWIQCRNT